MPDIILRTARPSDTDAVFELLMQTYRTTWEPHLRPEAAARFSSGRSNRNYVERHIGDFVVAERDGIVVGMVHVRADFIDALHVAPEAQGAGIGTRLLAHAEEDMRRDGHPLARLETDTFNAQSRGFYGKHGYSEVDTYPDEEWDSGLVTVLMTKPLDSRS